MKKQINNIVGGFALMLTKIKYYNKSSLDYGIFYKWLWSSGFIGRYPEYVLYTAFCAGYESKQKKSKVKHGKQRK
jgi:hypothetical protein